MVNVVAGPGSAVNGMPIEKLLERWWRWLLEIPDSINPSNDTVGHSCGKNQPTDDYFWLAGAHRDKPYKTMVTVKRSCTIPAAKAIGVAIAANECSTAEFPHLKNDQLLKTCARQGDILDYVDAKWDSKDLDTFPGVPNLDNIGVQTEVFTIELPDDNIFGAPPGDTQIAAHGFMVVITDADPGDHTFQFTQMTSSNPGSRTEPSGYQVTYDLKII
jgi:hypothetical protein